MIAITEKFVIVKTEKIVKFVNLEGYKFCDMPPHFLKDYGIWEIPDFGPIFYVRGAWSLDKDFRLPGISWWEDEELTYAQCLKAIELYTKAKPDFVVTHTAPASIIPSIPFKRIFGDKIYGSRTESMLEEMYKIHQPKTWIFGHFHVDWTQTIGKTKFICLNELSYIDFPKKEG